jgi:hypothetical protein
MNPGTASSIEARLEQFDLEINQRHGRVTASYSAAMLMGIGLFWFCPFHLSRVGSLVMVLGLAYMIRKVREAKAGGSVLAGSRSAEDAARAMGTINAQIDLLQSAFYNLPFVVGANLFLMGLPGTGAPDKKALLDCGFLAATILVFGLSYVINQQSVKEKIIPLGQELNRLAGGSRSH